MKHPDINYIILVPEQFTMQTQKELVLRHPRHGIMNIDVLSFARLAFRVLEETGNGSREILDDEGKNLILRRLAGKKEDSLKVLKGNIKKPGYISEVKSVISELTQYNISPDGMDDMITEADESSYLAWKLKDIQVMYQAFEEYLADKYITKEEILDILCNVMDKSRTTITGSVRPITCTARTPASITRSISVRRTCGTASTMILTQIPLPLWKPTLPRWKRWPPSSRIFWPTST